MMQIGMKFFRGNDENVLELMVIVVQPCEHIKHY